MSREHLKLNEARRIALAAQGFDRPRPKGKVNASHISDAIRRLGLVQIDYVNVLTPAHYQVIFSRLGSYEKFLFDDLVYRRREFTEQWAHERSILPVESWPLLRHRMETHRVRPWGFEKFLEQQSSYVAWALEEIRARGPLSTEDLPEPDGAPHRVSDKWGWGMNLKNQVLEAHFGFGRLAVVERLPNFARVYDLAERVIPAEDYFVGPAIDIVRMTVLAPGDLLTTIRIPATWAGAQFYFEKVRDRNVWDFPLVNVASAIKVTGPTIEGARIAVGAVAAVSRFRRCSPS